MTTAALLYTAAVLIALLLGYIYGRTKAIRLQLPKAKVIGNKDRKFGAANHYLRVWIESGDSALPSGWRLYTLAEDGKAMERADANKEDLV